MARTISRERAVGVMVQSGEGSPASGVATGDMLQLLNLTLNAGQQRLVRQDFGAGRDELGDVKGGNLEAGGSLEGHLILPGSFALPQHDRVFLSAFAIAAVQDISTTVNDTTPAVGSFDLTSVVGLQVDDILFVDVGSGKFEGRPISDISGNTVTFAIDFSAVPSNGATAQSKIYRFGSADQFLTIFDFLANHKRQGEDVLVNELNFTFEDVVNWTANFLATNVILTSETEPSTSFTGETFAKNFGGVWLDKDSAASSAFKTIDATALAIKLNNNMERNPVPVGKNTPDGITAGRREVRVDISMQVGTPSASNSVYFDDAVAKTAQRLFVQQALSDSLLDGENVAWHCPNLILERPDGDIDTSNPASVYNFNDSIAKITSGEDSLILAFG